MYAYYKLLHTINMEYQHIALISS